MKIINILLFVYINIYIYICVYNFFFFNFSDHSLIKYSSSSTKKLSSFANTNKYQIGQSKQVYIKNASLPLSLDDKEFNCLKKTNCIKFEHLKNWKVNFIDLSKSIHQITLMSLLQYIYKPFYRKNDLQKYLAQIHKLKYNNMLFIYFIPLRYTRGGANIKYKLNVNYLKQHLIASSLDKINKISQKTIYKCTGHLKITEAQEKSLNHSSILYCSLPAKSLYMFIEKTILNTLCRIHNVKINCKMTVHEKRTLLMSHTCENCKEYVLEFTPKSVIKQQQKINLPKIQCKNSTEIKIKISKKKTKKIDKIQYKIKTNPTDYASKFPPNAIQRSLQSEIITRWCSSFQPDQVQEEGCKVCGRLNIMKDMTNFDSLHFNNNLLLPETWGNFGVTRQERNSTLQPIQEISGPVLDNKCSKVCKSCVDSLLNNKTPQHALANGIWLGDVPNELKDLRYAEKLIIARVRHNRCIVRVSSGMHKMRANAILFSNPTPKIYNVLPPPKDELNEVLAFIFIGPCQPTTEDFKRIPLLIRRNVVAAALEWLKLNHIDYADLTISYKNLNEYPEDVPPVVIDYRGPTDDNTNKDPESTAVNDMEEEEGVDTGDCPFTVHGLSGEHLSNMSIKALTATALLHLRNKGKVLAIGHAPDPEPTYDNPQLYPKMLPWLFPYGLGGISNHRILQIISEPNWIKHMLMYHDKRFQKDQYFPLIALNHQQMKQSARGGSIVTERYNFKQIANRILNINLAVLEDLTKRLNSEEHVKPETEEEKACFDLINDLDHVAGHVQGSVTNKRYMRNEIWSLISYIGAATWFLTFAPADVKHPFCLYLADTKTVFKPEIRTSDERYALIAQNPVAGARFFHYMVQMFIKHVLGVNEDHPGLYGNTSAYYGTVEQQGRLTLHLHLMLWIENALSPQEIRDKIMNEDSAFQQALITYLESCHKGEFITGTIDEVKEQVENNEKHGNYYNPTETLPEPPPACCSHMCGICKLCKAHNEWWDTFDSIVDDIILKSNVHRCSRLCMANKHNTCKARFPRDIMTESKVDLNDGSIKLKKLEQWINYFTPILSYLLKCNSDISSLLSGTAIKAIVAYVTEYITKMPLKTHTMFNIIRNMFDKKSEIINSSSLSDTDKAKKLMTGVVNSMTANMEIGGPMAALYLLGNPDHYTSHRFRVFYWRPYVSHVRQFFDEKLKEDAHIPIDGKTDVEKVVIIQTKSELIGYSAKLDYIYRPILYEEVCLYDWIRLFDKSFKTKRKQNDIIEAELSNVSIECENDNDYNDENSNDDKKSININLNVKNVENDNDQEQNDTDNESIENESLTDNGSINNDVDNTDELDLFFQNENEIPNEKKSKVSQYDFHSDHPQSNTHIVKLLTEVDSYIPNFVSPIPRSDKGDREYYCATILCLFKNWRKPQDLKSSKESWDEAFDKFSFSDRQKQLLKNFNIRYECHDAKDDFRLQRKKKADEENDDVLGMSRQFTSHMNDNDFDPLDDYVVANEDYDEDKILERQGKLTIKRNKEMSEMLDILRNSGLMNESSDGYSSLLYDDDSPHFPKRSLNQWTTLLTEKRKQIINERLKNIPVATSEMSNKQNKSQNEVKIISFLYHNAEIPYIERERIKTVTSQFTLNEEQERAFNIVAQHSVMENPEQLQMHLGGMGGTGKSQVIKALIHFFKDRQEAHRFIVLAPTGSAAALVDGSTYHSVLAVNEIETDNQRTRDQIRERTQSVNYIFVDEVSMISCHDIYVISKQLAIAKDTTDIPFGGMNVIFAGDFAQLPPVQAAALYDGNVGTQLHSGMNPYSQESAIGKALWHQITTVVILRQNMRQKNQTDRDAKFRTALENMRYKNCTDHDIAFLKTLISGREQNISQKKFIHVPVIVRYNTYRDAINQVESNRFATIHKKKLHTFYSIDRLAPDDNPNDYRNKRRGRRKQANKSQKINTGLQHVLWNLPPHASSNTAGKLELCIGMPVMIKKNVATECCVTNGAQAEVYGWESKKLPDGKEILEILFVKLVDPPRTIKLDGLPDNVVPISKQVITIKCTLPDDTIVKISRAQVQVLLNFAMTDYGSQGRTRKYNVCELHNSKNHQSMYTALSRSSTAEGTIILQGFNASLITGGLSGYVRQEFRELEILNEITKLRYHNELPSHVTGIIRNTIIRQFYKNKSLTETANIVPEISEAIAWSQSHPLMLPQPISDSPWKLINKKKKIETEFFSNTLQQNDNNVDIPQNNQTNKIANMSIDKIELVHDLQINDNYENDQSNETANMSVEYTESIIKTQDTLTDNNDNNYNNIEKTHNNVKNNCPLFPQSKIPIPISTQTTLVNNTDEDNSIDNTKEINNKHILLEHNPIFIGYKHSNSIYSGYNHNYSSIPRALSWYANSCALDASLSIIYHIWNSNQTTWSTQIKKVFKLGVYIDTQFFKTANNVTTFESMRNLLRYKLNKIDRNITLSGLISIDLLLTLLTETKDFMRTRHTSCTNTSCEYHRVTNISNANLEIELGEASNTYFQSEDISNDAEPSIIVFLKLLKNIKTLYTCNRCENYLKAKIVWKNVPPLISLAIPYSGANNMIENFKINQGIMIEDVNGRKHVLYLRGIVYFNPTNLHYTARIIDLDGTVWFNDSLDHEPFFTAQGNINFFNNKNLLIYNNTFATLAIYAKNL